MSAVFDTLAASPFTLLCLLAAATTAVRALLPAPHRFAPAAAGAAIMAVGIFALEALPRLPVASREIARLLALELLVVWVCLAADYLSAYFRGRFRAYTADPVGYFAIGTWVAGTSVLAKLVNASLPEWRPLAIVLLAVAAVVWLAFIVMTVPRFGEIAAGPGRVRVTGRLLLAAVSTQSLVVTAEALFGPSVPHWLAAAMFSIGLLLYGVGVTLVVLRYMKQRGWRLADDWDNTNCILHGAMSISGLAAVTSGAVQGEFVTGMWLWAASVFVVVEAVEIGRLAARVCYYGWRAAFWSYDVSQWARNFTFGMFYAFTVHASGGPGITGEAWLPWVRSLQQLVGDWGQYVVVGLLAIELVLFLSTRLQDRLRIHGHAAAGFETAVVEVKARPAMSAGRGAASRSGQSDVGTRGSSRLTDEK